MNSAFSHLSDEELIQEVREKLPHADYNKRSGQFCDRMEALRIELFERGYRMMLVDGESDKPEVVMTNLLELQHDKAEIKPLPTRGTSHRYDEMTVDERRAWRGMGY